MKEERHVWRTENWLRVNGEVFMVQQNWAMYSDKYRSGPRGEKRREKHYVPFPTDEWRIVNLKEMVPQSDFEKLLTAAQEESS